MEPTEITNGMEPVKRPVFLTVLCVLTFISAGIGCFFSLFTPLFADTFIEFLHNSPNYDETQMADTIKVLQAGWGYYAPAFLLALGSLAGAMLMWNLKKIGFHFYAASNLALIFLPTLVLSLPISWFGVVITAAFITMYAVNLKHMS
ncbi:MAG: hypothetical protein ACT4ON_14545 [Bacteroidota bacterium]